MRGSMAKAAPLPGQRGYKMKESEKLEEEAAAMEQRLGVLRQRMVDEKESWASEKYVRYRWCMVLETEGGDGGG